MSAGASGGVFISYRRQEASGMAGRLYDRIADRFGEDQVFMDVDTIAAGVDFAEVITQAVSTCQVLLAVIGPRWLTVTGDDGRRRLDDAEDIVRLEIAAALERDIRVIPILIEGATMPRRQELPEGLAGLARRNALSVRHESFRADAQRLLAEIEPILRPGTALGPVTPAAAQVEPKAVDLPDAVAALSAVQVLRHRDTVHSVAFSPDGQLLATAGGGWTARVWEVASGRERIRVRHRLNWGVLGVAFSPDGRLLATASSDKTARLWEVANGQERARLSHYDAVRGVAFSPDGRLLATASDDGTARLWEIANGQERARLTHGDAVQPTSKNWVIAVVFSPDGQLLATASFDKTARLWEVANGQERARLSHGDHLMTGVAFSPDGRLLATASSDKTARLWEVASRQERARLTHDSAVESVAFSPDGRLLATGTTDGTARVWELASGRERALVTHGNAVQPTDHRINRVEAVAFSPDGRLLATGCEDHTARVWRLVGDH